MKIIFYILHLQGKFHIKQGGGGKRNVDVISFNRYLRIVIRYIFAGK